MKYTWILNVIGLSTLLFYEVPCTMWETQAGWLAGQMHNTGQISVKTNSNWYGPILTSPVAANVHYLQWNITLNTAKCCPGLVLLTERQIPAVEDAAKQHGCLNVDLLTMNALYEFGEPFIKLSFRDQYRYRCHPPYGSPQYHCITPDGYPLHAQITTPGMIVYHDIIYLCRI